MPFFDTHTHLDYLAKDSQTPVAQLLVNAQAANVQKILIVAVMAQDFQSIMQMAQLFPENLYYGFGLHPLHLKQHQEADLVLLESLLEKRPPNLVAIGEIGLERGVPALLEEANWRAQCAFFEAQLALAKKFQLPVNLHSRKSHEQLFSFLKRANLPKTGVVHGFSGSFEQAKRFVDLGYKIGVGGTITYERANKTRQTIAKLPLDALLLETDSPDMPPFGFQGQPNRPERIVENFKALCLLRQETPEVIGEQIWKNSLELFGIF